MTKPKSLKNVRKEFRERGCFYTPDALARRLLSYVDIKPESVYDPTCGVGNLLRVFPNEVKKYGQELDAEQLALVDIPNFTGAAGDTLRDDRFAGMKFDCIVANPPFSIKWNPDEVKDDIRFSVCPAIPPPSKADWAFMLHILHHLADDGVAVVLESPGILYRGHKEGAVREWFVRNNYIERVVNISGNDFEDTSISTTIIVLRKNKKNTDIIFEDERRSQIVPLEIIQKNNYTLSPNIYLPDERVKEEIDIDEINTQVIASTLKQVRETAKLFAMSHESMGYIFPSHYLKGFILGLKEVVRDYEE